MILEELIDILTKIKKRRGGKLEVILRDIEYSRLYKLNTGNITEQVDDYEIKSLPEGVRSHKVLIIG